MRGMRRQHRFPPNRWPLSQASKGSHARTIPGLKGELDVNYWVQLPPEYDPHRHYPIIVTLNGSGTTPLQQIDWWAGAAPAEGQRLGQATRHGYIVLAVEWLRPHQRSYSYSAREHYAVLASLRDAQRRFSIDTDRVFLSGHSIGGDAAWDLALAHPDLWAGVIPVVPVADRYCALYWQNATYVPFYVVAGEMDGDKMIRNARELDRYMQRGFDTTVAEFLGRGHEHFYDEIQHLFDWMQVRERNFYPKEIECYTMRPWDNFFWWIEADDFLPATQVDPASWPPARGVKPSAVTGKISDDRITVNTASKRVSLWLTPELIDFQKRNNIVVNGKRVQRADCARSRSDFGRCSHARRSAASVLGEGGSARGEIRLQQRAQLASECIYHAIQLGRFLAWNPNRCTRLRVVLILGLSLTPESHLPPHRPSAFGCVTARSPLPGIRRLARANVRPALPDRWPLADRLP